MANEKRMIDANVVLAKQFTTGLSDASGNYYGYADVVFVDDIENAPTVDAVEVVYCDECKSHGSCIPEETFRWMRIEKPYCCVGKRKTNTNFDAKMDGDGNG